jgi:hypothetical protein
MFIRGVVPSNGNHGNFAGVAFPSRGNICVRGVILERRNPIRRAQRGRPKAGEQFLFAPDLESRLQSPKADLALTSSASQLSNTVILQKEIVSPLFELCVF